MKRFAFYGRVSTEDQQDPESSKGWQLSRSGGLIEPAGGVVVTEYFDFGRSRSLPWKRRPEAAALLDALARPDRGFEAVVIGEPAPPFTATSSASPSPSSPTTAWSCGYPRWEAPSTRDRTPMTS